jgi:hypothetical protein
MGIVSTVGFWPETACGGQGLLTKNPTLRSGFYSLSRPSLGKIKALAFAWAFISLHCSGALILP